MKRFDLGNGHTLEVEKVMRENYESYKATFFEDGRKLNHEYCSKDALEWEYDITL